VVYVKKLHTSTYPCVHVRACVRVVCVHACVYVRVSMCVFMHMFIGCARMLIGCVCKSWHGPACALHAHGWNQATVQWC